MQFQFQTVRLQAQWPKKCLPMDSVSIPNGTITGHTFAVDRIFGVRFQFQTVRLQAVACKLRTSLLFGFNSKRYDYRVCVRAFSPLRQKVSIPNGTITGLCWIPQLQCPKKFQFQTVRLQEKQCTDVSPLPSSFNSKRYDYRKFAYGYPVCAR